MTLPSLADVLTAALTDEMLRSMWQGLDTARWSADPPMHLRKARELALSAILPPLQAREQTLREEGERRAWAQFEAERSLAIKATADMTARCARQAITIHDRQESWREMRDKLAAAEARVSSLTAEREKMKAALTLVMSAEPTPFSSGTTRSVCSWCGATWLNPGWRLDPQPIHFGHPRNACAVWIVAETDAEFAAALKRAKSAGEPSAPTPEQP